MSNEMESRFKTYSSTVRDFCKRCKWNLINREYIRLLIRSSGSASVNFIGAMESPGKEEENRSIKACLKDLRESSFWLSLILTNNDLYLDIERSSLLEDGERLRKLVKNMRKERKWQDPFGELI